MPTTHYALELSPFSSTIPPPQRDQDQAGSARRAWRSAAQTQPARAVFALIATMIVMNFYKSERQHGDLHYLDAWCRRDADTNSARTAQNWSAR
jgi:hypothetical protein